MVTTFAKKRTVSIFAAVLMTLALAAPSLRAQWTEVAPNLVLSPEQHVGALRFHGGVMWAGTFSLFYSLDSGVTWEQDLKFSPFWPSGTGISDIAIYDSLHILVSTYETINGVNGAGLFLTSDAGKTWSNVLSGTNFSQVAYNGSPLVLHAIESDQSVFVTSLDGGITWNSTATTRINNSTGSLCFAIAQDRTIYVQSYNGSQGWVNKSTDLGQTWSGNSQITDGDCETLAADSCNNMRLYLVNENVAKNMQTGIYQSKIDLTNDAGANWQTISSYNADYYNGSLASTADVLYVGTVRGSGTGIGVERSTDTGMTWQNIDGPNEEYDTRTIAAVNDSIVLVLDEFGDIWRTPNSGGFPMHIPSKFTASPATVFAADTIFCDTLIRSVIFSKRCPSPNVLGSSIIGANAASFKITNVSNDSISVTLYGVTDGEQHAELVISLDNGSSDTILLAGYVKTSATALSFATDNVHTDTLGGTVSVPIVINGLIHSENVELILNYAGTLDYLGSFSPSGVKLDIPGEQWPGRSELQVNGALSGVVAGYAEFNVFNDSSAIANATFDSLNILTPITSCEYAFPVPVTDTITTISGCGITMLSKWLYLGQEPIFNIWPNPASGSVWISSSDDLGDATITIYDMLGTQRSEIERSIQKGNPIELMLPGADGVYNILVKSSAGVSSVRVIRHQ